MLGMSGDDEEHPASSSAVMIVSRAQVQEKEEDLQSNTIAMAIRIIST